jgi:hypothetical protein
MFQIYIYDNDNNSLAPIEKLYTILDATVVPPLSIYPNEPRPPHSRDNYTPMFIAELWVKRRQNTEPNFSRRIHDFYRCSPPNTKLTPVFSHANPPKMQ